MANTSKQKAENAKSILDGLNEQLKEANTALAAEGGNVKLQKAVATLNDKVAKAQQTYDAALAKAEADGGDDLTAVKADGTFTHSDVPDATIEITVHALDFADGNGPIAKEAILNNPALLDELVQMNLVDGKLNQNGSLRIVA